MRGRYLSEFKFSIFIFLCVTSLKSFSTNINNGPDTVLGNETGAVSSVSGPRSVTVSMDGCLFRIALKNSQNFLFNAPDIVFYESKTVLKNLPYLWQAEKSAGYDWAFQKPGNLNDRWFGLMCEGAENLSWNAASASKQHEEPTPEQQQIRNSNDLKCPAKIRDGKWVLNDQGMSPENYLFKELKGTNWNGFVIGYKDKKSRSALQSLRFCLMHDNDVVIGASENYPKPLSMPISFFDTVQNLLSTVEFLGDKK